MDLKEWDYKVTEFKRALLHGKLSQCTEKEQQLFNRMYGSINDIKGALFSGGTTNYAIRIID